MAILLITLSGCQALTPSGAESSSTDTSGAAAGETASDNGATHATVVVASKDFTEEFILGEMYAILLENASYQVERKINLGGTPVVQQALLNEEVDVYPEYTGAGLLTVLKQPVMTDPTEVYEAVKAGYEAQFDLTWLDPAPMNNTQALAMGELPANFRLNGQPTIECDQNLREALSRLLRTNAAALVVLDDERPTGLLTLDDIRATTENTNSTSANNGANVFQEASSMV